MSNNSKSFDPFLSEDFYINFTNQINKSTYRIDPWEIRVQTASIFTVIAGIGVLINILPIFLTASTKLRENNVNILVAHLSVADLGACLVFVMGHNLYILFRDKWPASGCQWLGFVNTCCGFQVFIFPAVLSLNRYISLYYPDTYDRVYTRKNIYLMILGSWIFVGVIIFTFSLTGHTGWDEDNQHCCILVSDSVFWTVYFWIVCMGPIVGMGDTTVLFCNWRIYKKITSHAASQQMTKSVMRQHKELLYFLIIDMIVPICFHTTYLLAKFIYPHRTSLTGKRFFTILYLINSVIRSVIMMSMLRPLRNEFLRFFCGRKISDRTDVSRSKVSRVITSPVKVVKVRPL